MVTLQKSSFIVLTAVYSTFYFVMWHSDFPLLTTRHAIRITFPPQTTHYSNAQYSYVKAPVSKNSTLAVCMTGGLMVLPEVWPTMHKMFSAIDKNYLLFLHLSNFENPSKDQLEYLRRYDSPGIVSLKRDTPIKNPLLPTVRFLTTVSDLQKMLQQMQSLKECFESVEMYSAQYSVNIKYLMRTRSDTVITNLNESMSSLPKLVQDLEDGHLVLPDTQHDWFRGFNDRIAIGPVKTMKTYMTRIDHLWPDVTTMVDYHPEVFLRHVLQSNHITVRRSNWHYDEIICDHEQQ